LKGIKSGIWGGQARGRLQPVQILVIALIQVLLENKHLCQF